MEKMVQATAALVEFITKTRFEAIPAKGIKVAKDSLLDTIGCILLGATTPVGEIVSSYVKEVQARPVSSVVGRGFKTAPELAALANGTMGHAEDYDDTSLVIGGHPSVALVPAVLALAERNDSSGKDFIEAYVVGFEVEAKLGLALNPGHIARGWHSTSTLGTLGAAAAGARLLKLGQSETTMALAIASSLAAGLRQNIGTMTKAFHAGNAARCGVEAALLAEKGMTGDPHIIEAPLGFCSLFSGSEPGKLERITGDSAGAFGIVKSGIGIKPYPSCLATHPLIEGIAELMRQHDFDYRSIDEVECVLAEDMNRVLMRNDPKTGLEGKFSAEYCLARVLVDGGVGLADFTDERVNQAAVKETAKRVRRSVDPSLVPPGVRLHVRLKDGREFSKQVDKARGWPKNPLTSEELTTKFKDCAQRILAPGAAAQTLKLVLQMEEIRSISELTSIIGRSAG